MRKAIRWSDNDRYFGPFTYASSDYIRLAVVLGSGDGDDYPHCRLQISAFRRTLIVALPPIIKPWRRWVDTSRHEWSRSPDGGYWDTGERQYGFTYSGGHLSVALGRVTNDSETEQRWGYFMPWRGHRLVRHSLYDLDGEHFANLSEWGFRHKNGWTVRNAIEDACPTASFEFEDFDGEVITAKTKIEEREYKRGKGLFRLLYLGRNTISRSLEIDFSSEVGKQKGSWNGGTVGHSIAMPPGELHEAAFRRYCDENSLVFLSLKADDLTVVDSEAGAS